MIFDIEQMEQTMKEFDVRDFVVRSFFHQRNGWV